MDPEKDTEQQNKDWRKVKSGQRFLNAYNGLVVFYKTTRHIYVHIISATVVLALGFYFKISEFE